MLEILTTHVDDSLDDSMVFICSPPAVLEQLGPSDMLTEEEESVASLSPELPPVQTLNFDVECLDLDESDRDSACGVPPTPDPQAVEFTIPAIAEPTDVESLVRGLTILSPIQESEMEQEADMLKSPLSAVVAIPPCIESGTSPSAVSDHTETADADSPSLAHYIVHLVAPHKELQHTIDRLRPPLGYSLTLLCYSLTWWLVTKTPSQIVF